VSELKKAHETTRHFKFDLIKIIGEKKIMNKEENAGLIKKDYS
jgi:hypothetical protein